ncbi:AAA family ATPase [Desulfovibrio sp. JC010]|uniref:AAA family ATPase n=1 Tax=Desulfovibrio sp. JC010 TaxID=2593641 RepID=UPI0013D7D6C2|nr:ATP-binding protein [Desulfovibrio sp. JC010]NDV27631.1 AAA family ATPase [Desulfovibrio sp. JC010]
MITKIQLINWKSFADATLYIDPLTVLIGANSSGKSNVLDALEFIRRIASGVGVDAALAGVRGLPPIRGGRTRAAFFGKMQFTIRVSFLIDDSDYEYSVSVDIESGSRIISEYLVCKTDNVNIFNLASNDDFGRTYDTYGVEGIIGGHVLPAIYALAPIDNTFGKYLDHVKVIKKELVELFPFKPVPEVMREATELSEYLSYNGFNVAGFLANRADKTEVEKNILRFLTELPEGEIRRVWAQTVGLTKSKADLYCTELWGKNDSETLVDANSMSDGTLRFIAILVAVLTMEPGSLIAIEELDNGLHPSRAELLLRGLKELGAERGVDVLAVTHNPALLNALGPEGIPFVSVVHRDASGNSQITLLEDIEKLPKLMASGPLGDLVTQGRIQKALHDGED